MARVLSHIRHRCDEVDGLVVSRFITQVSLQVVVAGNDHGGDVRANFERHVLAQARSCESKELDAGHVFYERVEQHVYGQPIDKPDKGIVQRYEAGKHDVQYLQSEKQFTDLTDTAMHELYQKPTCRGMNTILCTSGP